MKSLPHQAIECKFWDWLPGMKITSQDGIPSGRVIDVKDTQTNQYLCQHGKKNNLRISQSDLPDLEDPATLGCLLYLVRKAWPYAPAVCNRYITYSPEKGMTQSWGCLYYSPKQNVWLQTIGQSEAEALIRALQARESEV